MNMRLSSVMRLINNQSVDALRKSIKLAVAEAPIYLNTVKEEKKKIVYDKLVNLNKWYTKIIGLDEVKLSQDKVTALQEQLLTTQDKRRDIGKQLAEVRKQSLELQDAIQRVKRTDDKFLDLMRQETEVLKLEKSIASTFQDYDQMERELFTAFTNAIRDSHEKQRAQLEYTKYFGLVLSIAGSFLAFVYSTAKKHDLKAFIEEKLATLNIDTEPIVSNLVQANDRTLHEVMRNREKLNEVVNYLNHQNGVLINGSPQVQLHPQADQQIHQIGDFRIDVAKVFIGMISTYLVFKILSTF
ncbi:unnamed protein product [Acanthoscelides obtectus]|uniref:Coiled-coil domain-containing protein 51 n=1 Tax=Acanthoscelides obtectus TaxID=200917 RepID=A0A9P0PT58_ACAOB|nr:unnamed protein product [Acanthoscelides obtectus]CAK1660815.1 Coiled-coil domain-containing protein 51 [Acanthoscelides obtectus]